MPKIEVPLIYLESYLPAGTSATVIEYLQRYKVHLTITRERKSILGDYRHRNDHHQHRISINGNLNPFAFLITLLHELAHLLVFEKYGNKVKTHGQEWKVTYGELLTQFIQMKIFPIEVENRLKAILLSPAAGTCAEEDLIRVLRLYDRNKDNYQLLEELGMGVHFRIKDGRIFQKGEKLRKRYKCRELNTGKIYLFSPVYEVQKVEDY